MPGSFSSQRKSRICPIGGLWTIGSELDRETREQFACGCLFNRQAKQDAPRASRLSIKCAGRNETGTNRANRRAAVADARGGHGRREDKEFL